jgi:hypothetical protein
MNNVFSLCWPACNRWNQPQSEHLSSRQLSISLAFPCFYRYTIVLAATRVSVLTRSTHHDEQDRSVGVRLHFRPYFFTYGRSSALNAKAALSDLVYPRICRKSKLTYVEVCAEGTSEDPKKVQGKTLLLDLPSHN